MYSGKVWRLLESETKGRKIKLINFDVCLNHQLCSLAVWWRWIGRRRRQHRLHSREHRVTISTQAIDICKQATPLYHRGKLRRMFFITQTFGTLCKTTVISLRISAFIQGKKILANHRVFFSSVIGFVYSDCLAAAESVLWLNFFIMISRNCDCT